MQACEGRKNLVWVCVKGTFHACSLRQHSAVLMHWQHYGSPKLVPARLAVFLTRWTPPKKKKEEEEEDCTVD